MSAYRLETFPPASRPARPSASTRSSAASRPRARRPTARGFLAGQAAATDGFLEEQGRLTSELVEAIADARVTNEAARRHVAAEPRADGRGAGRRRSRPALAEAGLGAEIARHRRAGADRRRPAARPRLRCAPGARRAHRQRCSPHRGLDAAIEEAPELLPREAQIFWDQGYDHLDLDACIAQIRACIASHLATSSKGEDDDPSQYG